MKQFFLYLLAGCVLAVFLQLTCSIDFLYAEQFRLFLYTSDYAVPFFLRAGGPVGFLDSFTLQFFALPCCGAIIVALMFVLMGYGTDRLLGSIAPGFPLPAFGILVALMQVSLATETYYSLEQTWAQIIIIYGLLLFSYTHRYKHVCLFAFAVVLYYLTGILALFAIILMLLMSLTRKEVLYKNIASASLAFVLVVFLVWTTGSNDLRHTWTLDAYYGSFFKASGHSYLVLTVMMVGVLTALLLKSRALIKRQRLVLCSQIVVAVFLGGWYFMLCHGLEPSRVKKLEVWRWNHEWSRILSEEMPTERIPLYANYQNLALAAEGRMAEELMNRGQCGPTGLQQVWQGLQQESDLLSDVFMQQGHVAMAQKMAFTAMQANRELIHGRLMLRLIETNLILEADMVAEKYINILDNTLLYRKKAEAYRRFIGHPELVSADKYMGSLQKCTRGLDWCVNDYEEGLKQIISANPSYRNALEYLGCYYLLSNNATGFRGFMNNYWQYPGLNPLPASFQKASKSLLWRAPETEIQK